MRAAVLFTLLLSSLFAVVFGWSKEDHEIFRIRDELELNEGEGVTFYDFIGVKSGPAASAEEITKSYYKTSARIHPDKFKPKKGSTRAQQDAQRKKASERFTRLGLIAGILRGPMRDRYDHFLRNGFPKWRGTGYYYARFRPGIGSVLLGIYLLAGVAHYVVLIVGAKRQRQFMEDIIKDVRHAAFGSAGVPGLDQALDGTAVPVKKKSKKKLEKEKDGNDSGTGTPSRKKVTAPSGKQFLVDPRGDVFLLDETEDGVQELLLDPKEVPSAAWRSTLLARMPLFFWRVSIGRFFSKAPEAEETEEVVGSNGATKKRGAPRKLERAGEGLPRRRTAKRAVKKEKE